ncbi:MAG: isochorismatase family protein [Gemmatales bacterium]|nr:isochorismatase family protein [Gemmatales bacterium]MDW8175987.1 isochorismatase family protein [Gemmatales bacterium]
MRHPTLLDRKQAAVLVVDVQEKLLPLIPQTASLILNIRFMLEVARLVQLPVQATEQYPKGLGPTTGELVPLLPPRKEKLDFSCCGVPEVVAQFRDAQRRQIVVVGIETHVCVLQTVLDLLAHSFQVHVPVDAVAARFELDHRVALERMRTAGAILSSVESVGFELLQRAGTAEFKEFSRLVQERAHALSVC